MNTKPVSTLHIIADSNAWGAASAFKALDGYAITLDILDAQAMNANSIKDADVLIVRSSVQVNEALLKGSKVKFVGTATIGDDHVDLAYLKDQGIAFASAAGSSTESVVEYMLACLYQLQTMEKLDFDSDTLGIIGVGRIGSLLEQSCEILGLQTELNDPPRQREEELRKFKDIEYLLKYADVLTLHTPLIRDGKDNTVHLLDADVFSRFHGNGIINAGRGPCVDNQALRAWLDEDSKRFAILDCWEGEPSVDLALVTHPQVVIATPHIAGHSLDGKAANTLFVYNALCDFLEVSYQWDIDADLPEIDVKSIDLNNKRSDLIKQFYPIVEDSNTMKEAAETPETFAAWFRHYRNHYPIRRSWRKTLQAISPDAEDMFL
ncbi:MAG: hypothetical protein AUK35_00105 [Zetaproteobacteria bacterium CG2_30_46_52]|nr:MAG: hypothetical protein AUK35_00105 [Zetaproteobacteria bacterium CG2_30_46_52]